MASSGDDRSPRMSPVSASRGAANKPWSAGSSSSLSARAFDMRRLWTYRWLENVSKVTLNFTIVDQSESLVAGQCKVVFL